MFSWRNSVDQSWTITLAGPVYVHFSFQLIQKDEYTSLNFTHNTCLEFIWRNYRGGGTESVFFPVQVFSSRKFTIYWTAVKERDYPFNSTLLPVSHLDNSNRQLLNSVSLKEMEIVNGGNGNSFIINIFSLILKKIM